MRRHLTSLARSIGIALLLVASLAAVAVAAGPPYPDPIEGQAVYDEAGVLSAETEARVEATIDAIEQRTGAEVVVYTQIKPESDSPEEAEQDAIALIDQWGVGRKGFDDGLAILFDLDESRVHGQVQLYAGPGYRATFLSNEERQRIFDEEMLPLLRAEDLEGALLVAMERIDANATPEHAQALERARLIDAGIGIIGAPILLTLLVGWVLMAWARHGRDPVYLDDPSILMPAPPSDLTAASGALIHDGTSSRHTLTTAMLDLASRGELAFRDESGVVSKKVGLQILDPDSAIDPDAVRARRRPISRAERLALAELQELAAPSPERYVSPEELLKFGPRVSRFNEALEGHVVDKGWFRERPGRAISRWGIRGSVELFLGIVGLVAGLSLPSAGLLLLGGAVTAAGVVTLLMSRAMPSRTMPGAMIYAMLAAYRRTLHKTMEQARSMRQVVESRAVPWLETPDQAVVWGVALGLNEDVERVLERTMEDTRSGAASGTRAWFPAWYGSSAGSSSASSGGGGLAPGLFSASAVPNFGAMTAAIGTIGNSPSSSGSGGGGFSGGSGGGGGGSGGGF
ncbi:MAG: TPM domain-containing protein [Candidatus Limnocylindrales bacterium]